jgi:hypothetical protein
MDGETDLTKLLREMNPELHAGEFVFCSIEAHNLPENIEPLGLFREQEGLTVILPKAQADELGWRYSFVGAWITLNVHSALDAVGLTAAVSQALTRAGVSCNVVAAYYHDHIFVPIKDAERALEVLQALTRT